MSEEVKAETPPVEPAAPAVPPVVKPVVAQPWVSKRKKPSSIDEKQAALKGK